MNLGEILVHHFTKFHQKQMKIEKVLLIACFSVQNFQLSVESWKSYIVQLYKERQSAIVNESLTLLSYVSDTVIEIPNVLDTDEVQAKPLSWINWAKKIHYTQRSKIQ